MNIVIPLGGKGERFKDFGTPKPFIDIYGKQMIDYVIDNLAMKDDKIFIIYNKNLDKSKFPKAHLIELDHDTSGAAETVFIGLQKIKQLTNYKKTILLDCDTFYTEDILELFRRSDKNSIFYTKKYDELPIYSYIQLDGENVIKISEKQKISENANTGAYAFLDIDELYEFSKQIVDGNFLFNGERYTSCIIHKMIEHGISFNGIELNNDNVFSLGTPKDLNIFKDNCRAFLFDLDGTLIVSDDIYTDVWKTLLEPYGIAVTKEFFASYIQGNNDFYVNKSLSLNAGPELSKNKDSLFLKNIDKVIVIEGVLEFLNTIKKLGHKCAIITNCNRQVAEKIVEYTGISNFIDFIIASEDCSQSKPHPEPYENALKKYKMSNEQCFIFEDSKTGITSGKAVFPKCLVGIETTYDKENLFNSGCNIALSNYNIDIYSILNYKNDDIEKMKNYIKTSYNASDVIINESKLKGGYIGDVLSLTVIKNGIPIDCVIKIENKTQNSLSSMASKLQLYEREYNFYETVSRYVNIRTPKFYCIVRDDNLNNYGILMENLFKLDYQLNVNLNVNIDISLKIIEHMVNFHVKFWGKNLSIFHLEKTTSKLFMPFWKDFIDERWDNFKCKWGNAFENIVKDFENIQKRLSSGNQTIVHGDIKSANIFYDLAKNEPIFLDWQHIIIGKGVQDLIFFIIESFHIDNIKLLYPIFKNYYYKKIIENGISYSYEEYEQDIKDAISYIPFCTAVWFGTIPIDELIDKNFPFFFIQKLFYLHNLIFK